MYTRITPFLLLFLPSLAAAAGYIQLEPLPYLTGTDISFPKLMEAFFRLCMIGGAVLAVLMITLGGVQYMTSDVLGMKEAGRSRMKNAAYGLILLLSIWIILNTINPALLRFTLNIGTVTGGNGPIFPSLGPSTNPTTNQTVVFSDFPSVPPEVTLFPTGTIRKNFDQKCGAAGGTTQVQPYGNGVVLGCVKK